MNFKHRNDSTTSAENLEMVDLWGMSAWLCTQSFVAFCCVLIKKVLGIFRELIPRTRRSRSQSGILGPAFQVQKLTLKLLIYSINDVYSISSAKYTTYKWHILSNIGDKSFLITRYSGTSTSWIWEHWIHCLNHDDQLCQADCVPNNLMSGSSSNFQALTLL